MDNKKITGRDHIKETVIDYLTQIHLFDELIGDELKVAATHMNYLEMKKGQYLFKEGDNGDYVCFVVEGEIDVIKQSASEKKVKIATLPKGSTLGEMSIIDHTPRSASARAGEDTTLILFSQKGFNKILDEHPKIGIKILKGISRLLSLNMRRTSSLLADYMLPVEKPGDKKAGAKKL
ncbi:MAG: cyclic nucleotide-binding domain-containing protein [Desulfobacula sp.]|jgi:CRP-like cAMP-binding protein